MSDDQLLLLSLPIVGIILFIICAISHFKIETDFCKTMEKYYEDKVRQNTKDELIEGCKSDFVFDDPEF